MSVIFSTRAMVSLLVETKENISTETGGVFLGQFINDTWYIIETVDPGPKAIFKETYFEYDRDYINHLINKLSRIYSTQLDLIGLWHRHPGSLDTFSSTDDITNSKYAKLNEFGAISGIVNIDPNFRLTLYRVEYPLDYTILKYTVDDNKIPKEVNELINHKFIEKDINRHSENVQKAYKYNITLRNQKIFQTQLLNSINDYLKDRTISDIKILRLDGFEGDYPIHEILELVEDDLDFLQRNSSRTQLTLNKENFLELSAPNNKLNIVFGKDNENIVFQFKGVIYKYYKGLFIKAFNEMRGRSNVWGKKKRE